MVIHRFDKVEVEPELGEVRVDGRARPVEPQVVGVLTYLIDHRTRVVGKEELLDEVWGTRHVSDAAITSRIKSARQAIGDSGREQRYIKTIHGRGYRFVVDIDRPDDEPGGVGDGAAAARADRARVASAASPASAARRPDDGWPLVGRDAELADIGATLLVGRSVLLTGPAGVGKTRLARALLENAAASGAGTARINGHTEAAGIPLAAMAHLLPDDLVGDADLSGDFARTILIERARSAIGALAGGRLVLMVDDVDRVDSLSLALLGSLIDSPVSVLMTQRDTGERPAFAQLIESGRLIRREIGSIAADRLAELLTVVLDGPVRPQTTESLIGTADGNPGLLRQLVESSRAAGTLTQLDGVWELTGPIAPGTDMVAVIRRRLGGLTPPQLEAAEMLALAGELSLDLAFELVADETLDALELAGLLSVREVGATERVRLVHPLFEEVLRADIGALRERTLRRRLAAAMGSWIAERRSVHPADRLQLVRFQLDGSDDIDESLALESARLALIDSDVELAGRLLDRIDPNDPARDGQAKLLHAKRLFLLGRFDEADTLLRTIDVDRLRPDEAAIVVRRMTTAIFYSHWRMLDAVDYLSDQLDRFEGEDRARLEAFWVMLAGVDGRRTTEAIALGERLLDGATRFTRAEALAGLAMAHCMRGQYASGLARAEEFDRLTADLPAGSSWVGRDYVWTAELLTLTELGRGDEAWAVATRELASDSVPSVGFLAISSGRVALRTGRPEQALRWLTPLVRLCETIGAVTSARPMQATTARAALATGDLERARREAAIMEATVVDDDSSMVALDMLESALRIEAAIGNRESAVGRLIDTAARARAVDQRMMESSLLAAAVEFGGADRALEPLEALASVVDPGLIELKIAHARAALHLGPSLDEVARRYEAAGFAAVADAVRATPI